MFEHGQLGLGENDPGAKARIAGRRSCSFSRKAQAPASARTRSRRGSGLDSLAACSDRLPAIVGTPHPDDAALELLYVGRRARR